VVWTGARRRSGNNGFSEVGNMSDAQEKIRQTIQDNDVVLFMKGSPDFPQCGFSGRAVQVLQACGARFASVDVLSDPDVREGIKRYSNWPTIPQLYVKGEFVGGSDIMMEMYQKGELQEKLKSLAS
jgi:monothiol glutaredoxin